MLISKRKITLEQFILATALLLGVVVCCNLVPLSNQTTFILYASSLLTSLFFIVFSQQLSLTRLRDLFFWLGILLLGSIMAFRAQTGLDDVIYKAIFHNAQTLSISEYFTTSGVEKGYLLVNWLLYYLTGGDYNIAQAIITFGTFILWGWTIRKQSISNMSIPIVILFIWSHYYFFVMSAGLVRIFIAIPIVWYALRFVWENNWKQFTFWILIASLFHMSALVMLLFLLFIFKADYFFKHWFVFVLLTTVVVSISFLAIARYLIPLLGARYEGYAEVDDLSISLGSFDTIPIWIIAVYYYRRLGKNPIIEQRRYIIGIVLLSLSIVFSVAATMVSLGRVIFYANLGILIISSSIFGLQQNDLRNTIIKLALIIYALVYVMYTTMLNPIQNETLFPYYSFFFTI